MGKMGAERKTTPRASIKATQRELAWAAGFLEGEGSFQATGRTVGRADAMVSAAQVNREPLDRLAAIFGGSVKLSKRNRDNPKWSPCYLWLTAGARARGIAMTLYLLMSEKRKGQIHICLGGT